MSWKYKSLDKMTDGEFEELIRDFQRILELTIGLMRGYRKLAKLAEQEREREGWKKSPAGGWTKEEPAGLR